MKFNFSPKTAIEVKITLNAGDLIGDIFPNLLDEMGLTLTDPEVIIREYTIYGEQLIITVDVYPE